MFRHLWICLLVANLLTGQIDNRPFSIYLTAVPNKPFRATIVSDGSTIATVTRDSKGRTYRDMGSLVEIVDPTNQKRIMLIPKEQRATTFSWHLDQRDGTQTAVAGDREDLGLASLNGLTIHGYRRVETRNKDLVGAITLTHEDWYSDDLAMVVQRKMSTEAASHSVQLSDVKLEEPDPALFEIAANYKIDESNFQPQGKLNVDAATAEANLVQRVDPVYPPLAKSAHVQGTVKFNIVIGEDGSVKSTQLISGHPLLVIAAKEAVLEWKYRPTLLNGEPISVNAPVSLTFALPAR